MPTVASYFDRISNQKSDLQRLDPNQVKSFVRVRLKKSYYCYNNLNPSKKKFVYMLVKMNNGWGLSKIYFVLRHIFEGIQIRLIHGQKLWSIFVQFQFTKTKKKQYSIQ